MTWTLRDIVFPIDPSKLKKRTIRFQQPTATIGDFPDPSINQPTRFELQIEGFIWPRDLAQQLDEATKNAETESLPLDVSDDTGGWLTGLYSVTRSEVKRDKPLYDSQTGEEVYQYKITLAKFADLGADQPADEGGPGEDEEGTGFLDLPEEVGFDANGDGDIDPDELFNWMTNILTFGLVGN